MPSDELSFSEQRFWYSEHSAEVATAFVECPRHFPVAVRLRGELDLELLTRSFNDIVMRHAVLRSTFPARNGRPMRRVSPFAPIEIPVVNGLSGEHEVGAAVTTEVARPFELGEGPLFRVRVFRIGAEDHVFLLVVHHIVFDGWSKHVLWREFTQRYEAHRSGAPSPIERPAPQYEEYVRVQREWLDGPQALAAREYWAAQLADARELVLPGDKMPARPTARAGMEPLRIAGDLAARLRAMARAHGALPTVAMTAVAALLLHTLTGADDLVIGASVADRSYAGFDTAIGLFLNLVILRIDLTANPTFSELLGQVRGRWRDAYAHCQLPFDRAFPSGAPLAPRIVCNMTTTRPIPGRFGDALAEPFDVQWAPPSLADLSFHLIDFPDGMRGFVLFKADLFSQDRIQSLARLFLRLTSEVLDAPGRRVAEYAHQDVDA